ERPRLRIACDPRTPERVMNVDDVARGGRRGTLVRGTQQACLPAVRCACAEHEAGAAHAGMREVDGDVIGRVRQHEVRQSHLDRARSRVHIRVEVALLAGRLTEATRACGRRVLRLVRDGQARARMRAGWPGRSSRHHAVRSSDVARLHCCRGRQQCECEQREEAGEHQGTTMRPIVPVSAPNQIVLDGWWYIMWRTVPPPLGTSVVPKNVSVAGSNPTKRFGCTPDSTIQMRSRASTAIAYGRLSAPLGMAHSFTCSVAGSKRPRKPSA